MLEQVLCGLCGTIRFDLYTEPATGEMHIACSNCGAIKARLTGKAPQQPTPLDPDSDQALGSNRDEPKDMGTQEKGTQG
jgi:hypothetical protein